VDSETTEQEQPKARKAKLDAKGRPIAEKPEDTKRDKAGQAAKAVVRMGVFLLGVWP
jgi:hypothetical protein